MLYIKISLKIPKILKKNVFLHFKTPKRPHRVKLLFRNMTNIEHNHANQIQIVRGNESLNSEGCQFFVDASTEYETLVSSASLRWLTHGRTENTFFTPAQQEAVAKIKAAHTDRTTNTLNTKILLYENPIKAKPADVEHIAYLLQCGGVEMRYLKKHKDQQLRIAQQGHKLYISLSDSQRLKVDRGIVYTADSENDPLVAYFRGMFFADFNKAKPLKYDGKKITYVDSPILRAIKWFNIERLIAVISLILGLIFGLL